MGPRPRGRGEMFPVFRGADPINGFNGATPSRAWRVKPTLRVESHVFDVLQWGHALAGVESSRPSLSGGRQVARSFNGAPPSRGWGVEDAVCYGRGDIHAFMRARP